MKKMLSITVLVTLVSGCASITTGQNQSISVETGAIKGAVCELSNDKGKWFVSSTPGSTTVSRAYGDLTVSCNDAVSGKSGMINVKSSTKGMAYGNILAGGIIGAAVDCGTGCAYDYPSVITVPLS